MPNQGNKSKGRTDLVQKKRKPTMPATESQDKDGNAAKHKNDSKAQKGDTGSSAKEESKKSSGNSGND